ncbi:MAG: hypothetical protein K1X88_05720 [Nannocystaceae bacterium]|nr:hypothetical protein [Nannocystaceae bacterium]
MRHLASVLLLSAACTAPAAWSSAPSRRASPQPEPAPAAAPELAVRDGACGVTVVAAPATELGAPTWTGCGEGCEQLATPWSSATHNTLSVHGPEPVRRVGGAPLLTYMRHEGDSSQRALQGWTHVVTPLRGAAVFGLRADPGAPDGCAVRVAVGERGVAAIVHTAGATRDALVRRPWGDAALERVVLPELASHLAVGDPETWVELEASGVVAVDPAGALVPVATGATRPRALPRGALLQALDRRTLVRALDHAAVASHAAAGELSELAIDRRSGAIVWVDAQLDPAAWYRDATLWLAPGDDASPRAVAPLPDRLGHGGWGMVADDGRVLTIDHGERAVITRLHDGEQRDVAPPAGLQWLRPLWIDETTAWLLAGPPDDPDRKASTIVAQRWDGAD